MDEPQLLKNDVLGSPIKRAKLSDQDSSMNASSILNQDPQISSFYADIKKKEFDRVFNYIKESVSWKEDLLSLLSFPNSSEEFKSIYSDVFCEFWKELAIFLFKNEIVVSPLDLIISEITEGFQTSPNRTIRLASYNFLFTFLACSPSSDLYEKLYARAFRDVFHCIRVLSIQTLNNFIKDAGLKKFILKDQKLKYAGWMLNDKDYKVRELALVFIGKMLLSSNTKAFGKSEKDLFYKKFGPRIEDMLNDKNPNVVIKAIDLLEKTEKDADYNTLIFEDNAKIRSKMVDVYTKGKKVNIRELEKLLKEALKTNYKEEDKTNLMIRAISIFITKKRLIIDYSLIKKFDDFEFYLSMSLLSLVKKDDECKENITQIMSLFYKLFKKLCTTKNHGRLKVTLSKLAEEKVNIILKQQESTFIYNKIAGLLAESNEKEYMKFLVCQLVNNEYNRDSLLSIMKKTITIPNRETKVKEVTEKKNIELVKEFLLVLNEYIPGIEFFSQQQSHVEWVKQFILSNSLLVQFELGDIAINIVEVILLQLVWKLNIVTVLNNNFDTSILMQTNREEALNNMENEDEKNKVRFLIEVLNQIDFISVGNVLNSLLEFSKHRKQRQAFFESKVLGFAHMIFIILGGLEAKKQSGSSLLHMQFEEQLFSFYKEILLFIKNVFEKITKEDSVSFKFIVKIGLFMDFISGVSDLNLGNIRSTVILKMLSENIRMLNEGFTKTHIQIFRDMKQICDVKYTVEVYLLLCYDLIKNGKIDSLELIKIQDFRKLFFGNKGTGIESGILKGIEHIKTDINIDLAVEKESQEKILSLVQMFMSTFNIKHPSLISEMKAIFDQNN